MNQALNENERLLEQVMSKDIVNLIVNSSMDFASVNVHECEKCLKLKTELQKDFVEKEIYDKLFKRFTTLEKHCILLEVDTQLNQEIFQRNNSISNQSAPSFDQLFELNELKAQSQEKDMVIKKLKERIKSLSGNMDKDKIKQDLEEIETINIELDHRVTKLIAENEHLKQTYKQLYDSIKPARVRSQEQCVDLTNQVNLKSVEISDLNACLQEKVLVITKLKDELRKLKEKDLANNEVTHHPSDPEINTEPITPKLLNKRFFHFCIANKKEPSKSWGSIIFDVPSSSFNECVSVQIVPCIWTRMSKLLTEIALYSKLRNKFLGYSSNSEIDHVGKDIWDMMIINRNVTISRVTMWMGLDMMASSLICLLSKASKTKSWLWHRRLSHLNFGTINHLARHGLVRGLPKLKFEKDHLCSACAMGKSKKKPHTPKSEDTNQETLYLLHMDLYGPMHVASVNGKKYILVIIDDYSRFTWIKCLRSKDEVPDFINKFLRMIQKVGISHETYVARSLQQNGVIERRNRTLIEATHTMLIYTKAPLFLWVEVVATACYTQNRSIVRLRHGKTPYELLHGKTPYEYLVHSAIRQMIVRTWLTAMASKHSSSGPALHEMTPATISS
ncbi:retrovirus-related pol polyprotein from transposon TNT 1-94 [Tanacetum coccineum]